ncbi:MAG: hypothetical protein IT204_20745 [Fimbriimonadaceae bacterium]|nr:hypothetical protein [Fimbriimonadaceae bacterium]
MSRPQVVIAKAFPADLVAQWLPDCSIDQGPADCEWSRQELLPRLATADALISWAFNRIDRELLAAGPRLRIVSFLAIGTDNFDRPAMQAAGVWGTHVPGAFAGAAAEVAVGLMLLVLRRLGEAERYVRAERWQAPCPGLFDGPCLEGKRLGLLGCGQIGRRVARAAAGFGMAVSYHDQQRLAAADEQSLGLTWRPFDELLASSQVLSLHVPLTPATRHLIDAAALARLPRGAVLINTSRGPVVDEPALLAALDSGQLGGAGLDVFEFEPRVPAALLARENVALLPHLAGGSSEARRAAQTTCLQQVAAVLAGAAPAYPVVRPGAA